MIIAITCVVAIAVIAFILGVRPKDIPEPEPVSPFRHLDERKAAIYENLRDLQFEYRVGKLSDDDYQSTKKDLQKELARVLAEVDKLKNGLGASACSRHAGQSRGAANRIRLPGLRREVPDGVEVLRGMREADEVSAMTLRTNRLLTAAALMLFSVPGFAAITGTVINKTTGKPQAGATVALNKLGAQLGIEMVDQAKSGADGTFTINQSTATSGPPTPYLLRTAYDGVTYNHMLPPGSQTTGLTIEVYDASKQPGSSKVTKHMVLFQPGGGQMTINETYLRTRIPARPPGTIPARAHSISSCRWPPKAKCKPKSLDRAACQSAPPLPRLRSPMCS